MERFVGKRHAACDWNTYEIGEDEYAADRKYVFDQVVEYARDPASLIESGNNLVLVGTVGTGKDHLMTCVCRRIVAAGHTLRVISGFDLYEVMQRSKMTTGTTVPNEYKECDVLAISDIEPISGVTDFKTSAILALINYRYVEMKPTLVTSNLKTMSEMNSALSDRVTSRLLGSATLCKCDWPDYRIGRK